jgi:hypothetical protein
MEKELKEMLGLIKFKKIVQPSHGYLHIKIPSAFTEWRRGFLYAKTAQKELFGRCRRINAVTCRILNPIRCSMRVEDNYDL